MIIAEKKEDIGLLAEIKKASTAQLQQWLIDSLRVTAERLLYLAAIVQELEIRGENLSGMRIGMMRWLRLIASGQLLPEVVVRYSGKQKLLERIATLPAAEQRRLIDDPTIVILAAGQPRSIDPLAIPYKAIDQVFADDHIRDEEEQEIWLGSRDVNVGTRKRRNKEYLRQREPHADHEHGGIRVGRSFVPKARIVMCLAELAGPLPEVYRSDSFAETATVCVTSEEKAKLKMLEKTSGLKEWQLIRQALHACGLI
jgi:hypothetical protein